VLSIELYLDVDPSPMRSRRRSTVGLTSDAGTRFLPPAWNGEGAHGFDAVLRRQLRGDYLSPLRAGGFHVDRAVTLSPAPRRLACPPAFLQPLVTLYRLCVHI